MPRKSTIETLPDDIRQRLNFLIGEGALDLDALTDWLDDQGYERSRSAVGRHAKKFKVMREKLNQSREMAKALAAEVGEDITSSKQGRMIVEILRTLVFEHLSKQMETGQEADPQSFFFLAKAIKDIAGANRLDQDYENKVREGIAKEERERAAETVSKVVTEAGLSKSVTDQIKKDILGM